MTEHAFFRGKFCRVCGMSYEEAGAECPRTRDWNIATRSERTLRINVDRCEECPFKYGGTCAYPFDPAPKLRPFIIRREGQAVPDFCELPGKVVMIGGPKR